MKLLLTILFFASIPSGCASRQPRALQQQTKDGKLMCRFNGLENIDHVDSRCIGPAITGTRKDNIIGAYFEAMTRPGGRPYGADLFFDRDPSRILVNAYKMLNTSSLDEQTYFFSVAFEDAQHEAILLGQDSSYPTRCLILYEQTVGEEVYRLTSARAGDTLKQYRTITLAPNIPNIPGGSISQKNSAPLTYVHRDGGYWIRYFEQSSGPLEGATQSGGMLTPPSVDQPASPGLISGGIDEHTQHGLWVEWVYSPADDSLIKWWGDYTHGLRNGLWMREVKRKSEPAARYNHGRIIKVY